MVALPELLDHPEQDDLRAGPRRVMADNEPGAARVGDLGVIDRPGKTLRAGPLDDTPRRLEIASPVLLRGLQDRSFGPFVPGVDEDEIVVHAVVRLLDCAGG